jgi:hypothetical protein
MTGPHFSDAYGELIEAIARRGDRHAFAALCRRFAPRVKDYPLPTRTFTIAGNAMGRMRELLGDRA